MEHAATKHKIPLSKEKIRFQNEKTFEKILQLSPLEIEILMEIEQKSKLPLFINFSELKEKVSLQEKVLKNAVMSGIQSIKIWEICKSLCFHYLICANIYLTQQKFDYFLKYHRKAEHIFHPPSKDSAWQIKPEWINCKMILSVLKSLHLAKEGKLVECLRTLENINTEESGKNCHILLRKISWALGTIYNKYKEIEKSIESFKKGLDFSDNHHEFPRSLNNLEDENFFPIHYVYFKYKIAKLLNFTKKNYEAQILLRESINNLQEIAKRLQSNDKTILAQDYSGFLTLLESKIKALYKAMSKKPKKNPENTAVPQSQQQKFNEYLLAIKTRKNPKKTPSAPSISKEELLRKLQQKSHEEIELKGEYLLKDVYKSGRETPKCDLRSLKNLSLSKSKEIHEIYINNTFLPRTSRTDTHRTFSSKYIISEENSTKSKVYDVLQRPSTERNLDFFTQKTLNSQHLQQKNRDFESSLSRKLRKSFATSRNTNENEEITGNPLKNSEAGGSKIKNLLKKIAKSKESEISGESSQKPSKDKRNLLVNTQRGGYLNVIEEKSSRFYTDKNSNSYLSVETNAKKQRNLSPDSEKLSEPSQNIAKIPQNAKNSIKIRIIPENPSKNQSEFKANDENPVKTRGKAAVFPAKLDFPLKEHIIQEISALNNTESLPKRGNPVDELNIDEEYEKILTKAGLVATNPNVSLSHGGSVFPFNRQISKDEAFSAQSRSSFKRNPLNHLSFQRKESSEDDRKSTITNFIQPFSIKPVEIEQELPEEEKLRRIKAKKLILSQFRIYKLKKIFASQQKNEGFPTSSSSNLPRNREETEKTRSATVRKSFFQGLRKAQTITEEKTCDLRRKLPKILDFSSNKVATNGITAGKIAQEVADAAGFEGNPGAMVSQSKGNPKKLPLKLKNVLQNLKSNILPSFFLLKFLQGKLRKFKVSVRKKLKKKAEFGHSVEKDGKSPENDTVFLAISEENLYFQFVLSVQQPKKPMNSEYKTGWPLVFEAFYVLLKEKGLVEDQEFYEEFESFQKFDEIYEEFAKLKGKRVKKPMPMSFLEKPATFVNKISAVDIEYMVFVKMLVEIVLEKLLKIVKKPIGLGFFPMKLGNQRKTANILRKIELLSQRKRVKSSLNLPCDQENSLISQLNAQIHGKISLESEEIQQELLENFNQNSTLVLFVTKDVYWRKLWTIIVSWHWEKRKKGPEILIKSFDWKYKKEEKNSLVFDWERFCRSFGDKALNFKELYHEFFLFSRLKAKTKEKFLGLFQRVLQISNGNLQVTLDKIAKKTRKNERNFFKKQEIFGFDLLNLKVSKPSCARNEALFKKGFDEIYQQFFEDKREVLDDDKDLNKIVQFDDFDEIFPEKHGSNKYLIEENSATDKNIKVLKCFRVEKQNAFYSYFKNFVKDRKLNDLHLRLKNAKVLLHLKVFYEFCDSLSFCSLILKFWHPLQRINCFHEICDLKDIILITNILLVENKEIKTLHFLQIISKNLQFNGPVIRRKSHHSRRKIIFNEYSLKAFVMNAFFDEPLRFSQQSVVFLANLAKIGRKFAVCVNLFENKQKTLENPLLFSIKLLDIASKTRKVKLILSSEDLLLNFSHFHENKRLFAQNRVFFWKSHFLRILQLFSMEKVANYPCLVYFPRKTREIPTKRLEKLRKFRNCFNEKRGTPIFPKRNNSFLEEFVQDSRVVLTVVRKYQGNFYFLAISKNLLLNYWIFKVYIPRNSRTFVGFLNFHELLRLPLEDFAAFQRNSQELLENQGIFPRKSKEAQDLPHISNDNAEERRGILKQLHKKFRKAYFMQKFTSQRMKKMEKLRVFMDLSRKIDDFEGEIAEKSALLLEEQEIWRKLLENLEISCEKSARFELKRGEFSLRLKEILYSKYVKIDKNNEAFIEIFFFFLNENPSVFATFEAIDYAYTVNHNFIIKYLSLNRMNIQIESLNLRELINIYISDGFYQHPINYMHSKLSMADIKDLCNFLIYKIKSANFCNFLHNVNENYIKRKKFHANDNVSYLKNIEKEAKIADDKALITTFIAKKTVVQAFVNISSKKILINLYKNKSGSLFVKEFPFVQLKNCNGGFLKELIAVGRWEALFERLWKVVGKELLVEAEFNFKFNER